MSVKIKISYEDDRELMRVIRLLSPVLRSWKRSRNMEGRYKKAYVELEHVTKPGGRREENGLKRERSPREA
nr:hypothetical protein [uncultured Mediterraneibacter sp.]